MVHLDAKDEIRITVIGIALVAIGGVLLWAAMTGRAEAVLTALKADISSLPQASNPNAVGSGPSVPGTGGQPPFNPANPVTAYQPGPGGQGGTFAGASGNTYSGSYASLTPAQRDDVNAYAKAHGG